MKFSTKIRYGAQFMVDLALRYGQGPVLLKDIARRQELSEKYLWQLTASLKRDGLVVAERGAKGGFALARAPQHITFRDIFVALEGDVQFAKKSLLSEYHSSENVTPLLYRSWKSFSDQFEASLASVTLENIAEQQRLLGGSYNYVI